MEHYTQVILNKAFEVNDIMDIASTIKSSTAQLDASDDNISMETVVRYRIKLV